MDPNQAAIFLEICKARILSQEGLNREYSTKATSVITLSVGLMVAGGYWLGWDSEMVGWLGFLVLIVALPALLIVVRPGSWTPPCDLLRAAGGLIDKDDDYVFNLAVAHVEATIDNGNSLRRKASCLTFCTFAVVIEAVLLVVVKVVPNIP